MSCCGPSTGDEHDLGEGLLVAEGHGLLNAFELCQFAISPAWPVACPALSSLWMKPERRVSLLVSSLAAQVSHLMACALASSHSS